MNGAGLIAALLVLASGVGSAVAVHRGLPGAVIQRAKPSFAPYPDPTTTPCNGPATSASRCTTVVIA